MDSFLTDIKSLSWWISVVVVGIVLSIVAAYLKDGIDRVGSAVSKDFRRYNSARAAVRAEYVRRLQSDKHEQVMLRLEVLDDRIAGIAEVATGALFGAAFKDESAWLLGIGALLVLMGAVTWRNAHAKLYLLEKARSSEWRGL